MKKKPLNLGGGEFTHKLWLYVEVGNEKFAVTIDRKPVFIGLCHSNADFKPLIRFIQRHLELLKNYANEKVDNRIFYEIIGQLQESVLNESVLLTEMSKLQPTETGLPCSIWVDEDKTYLPHTPKIGKL